MNLDLVALQLGLAPTHLVSALLLVTPVPEHGPFTSPSSWDSGVLTVNKMEEHVKDIVLKNQFKFVLNEDNLVRCVLGEIKMEKKCNKKEKSDEVMD